MHKTFELWGQIGATFHLTHAEMERFLRFDEESADLFATLVQERRYEIGDQFYVPETHSGQDLYISLNQVDGDDGAWSERADQALYPRKIWCRLGVLFSVDEPEMQTLSKQDSASANLVYDLVSAGRYRVEGSCLFESGNQAQGYDEPEEAEYIDVFAPKISSDSLQPEPQDTEQSKPETGIQLQ